MRRLLTIGSLVLATAMWTPTAAWADTTININPGSLNKTALQFSQICDPNQGGGPYPGKDVWVFNLPNDSNKAGVFVSVTATWTTPDGPVTRTIPTDGGAIVGGDKGTSKAYIVLPAGWTITAATAVITGVADKFVVTHTCADKPTGNPSNTPTPSPNPASPDPSSSAGTPPGGGGPGGSLPLTGSTTTVLLTLGAIAIAAGVALRYLYRRRRPIL
ncbi:LPXTG cell wall anchor domain-containing protein [Allorhizocola rhizosphaerae]|uniref:LPXTG cell wall anchor domain-containing protein n=1 Tax=Allorhizocola rhizosphaerae TaxID=1872709 RepID=UPI0013C32A23|nr:LPXTG cell wall anchor domain-containing protein [Allorhizocola rhizosphaerae]